MLNWGFPRAEDWTYSLYSVTCIIFISSMLLFVNATLVLLTKLGLSIYQSICNIHKSLIMNFALVREKSERNNSKIKA